MINTKVINGKIADYRDYPFFGILYIDNFSSCGCSYIGGPYNAVITAAHCLVDENNKPLNKSQLKIGFLQSRLSIPNLVYTISKVIIHPYYSRYSLNYDIAILLLSEKPNVAVRPLKIPSREQTFEFIKQSQPVEVIGFGLTCINCNIPIAPTTMSKSKSKSKSIYKSKSMSKSIDNKNAVDIIEKNSYIRDISKPVIPQIMRKGCINMISKKLSKYNLYPNEAEEYQLKPDMLVAGKFNVYTNPYDNVDGCAGDSGGPLLYKFNGRYQLLGLSSWGFGCGLTGYPGVYTYVSYYRNWIKKTTNLTYL